MTSLTFTPAPGNVAPPAVAPPGNPESARSVPWVCCQLGAREHYAVPRALLRGGVLAAFITDMWARPSAPATRLYPRRARERHHAELDQADVRAHTLASILLEIPRRLSSPAGWQRMVGQNDQFERLALRDLRRIARQYPNTAVCLYSFAYAARRLFEFAKAHGWTTVLGQIDGGPGEEAIVRRLKESSPALTSRWQPPPEAYWRGWRDECALADRIVVNSGWSRQLLIEEGIPGGKIRTVPLAYEPSRAQAAFRRDYPESFSSTRPLRVLFLSQLSLRKGIVPVLDAMLRLESEPVEFWFVGPSDDAVEEGFRHCRNARWHGAVPRGEVEEFYRKADVLLFPTFSDGFGITQLEAQGWRLPVIASRFCGNVVRDGVNGILLPEVSADALVASLGQFLRRPQTLMEMSRQSIDLDSFSIDQLSARLVNVL